MLNQELVNYIEKSLNSGAKKEDIKKKLFEVGWKDWDIDVAFSFVEVNVKEDLGGNSPKPVIEEIKTIDDLVCDMLRQGKSRDNIFEELLNAYDYGEIKRAFDRYVAEEEKKMSPTASFGFIVVALAFVSFISIAWDKLMGDFRMYAILIFCLFYFLSGLYIKYREKIILGGEIICFFSVVASGFSVYLLSNSFLVNLSWVQDVILWMFIILFMGVLADSLLILKFALLVGLVPAIAYPFMMIRSGESFVTQGFTWSNVYMIMFFVTLFLVAIIINKRSHN
ncbi:MAG: DUF2157 domain-containing protein [Candidatus Pacebacteria bacterium]|nr:DUF2157 domain-containing protein [Candidatus Paceibacterota bacterium]